MHYLIILKSSLLILLLIFLEFNIKRKYYEIALVSSLDLISTLPVPFNLANSEQACFFLELRESCFGHVLIGTYRKMMRTIIMMAR